MSASTIRVFAISIALAFVVAACGGLMTDLNGWYEALAQPSWKPPDSWFGPVWSSIFLCIGLSAGLCWINSKNTLQRRNVVFGYGMNAALNLAWSFIFFQAHLPTWALIEMALLWLSIAALIRIAWSRSRLAATLLLPYFVWVSFAATINYGVIQLN